MGNKSCINTTLGLFVFFLFSLVLTSCDDEADYPDEPKHTNKTILMYLPWSGDDIYDYFLDNISHFETAIENNNGLSNNRLIVFIADDESKAEMFEITYDNGSCRRETLKNYSFSTHEYTTSEGISAIINDVIAEAPAASYAMTIGCHGMGWLPVHGSRKSRSAESFKPHWEYDNAWATRYFGGASSAYQADISTLAESLERAGMPMEFILFDDCYMSSIEVAYTLRHVADYLIACPTEIMAFGMPYAEIGKYLLGEPDYENDKMIFYDSLFYRY